MMDKNLGSTAKKFLFDINDFDEEALRKKAAIARRPTFSQDEMEAARQTGFDSGRIEGMSEAIGSQEAQIRDLCQQIVIGAERLAGEEADRMATFIDQAALITVQALSKTLPVLLDLMAVDQIAAFVNKVLEDLVKSQTIVIFVAPSREAAVKDRLETMATTMRRKKAWTIQPDATLHDLQCRIEWSGGGAEWSPAEVSSQLLAAIMAHLPEHLRAAASEAPALEAAPAPIDVPEQTPHTDDTSTGDAE